MRLDDITCAHDDGALDDVFELADVAGPAVSFKRANRILAQVQILPALAFRVPLDAVVAEDRNIPLTLAKRCKLAPCTVQPIEQISAEAIIRHSPLQIR